MAARRGRAEQECESERPHAWGAAGGAGGGRRAAREGGAAGRPLPLPSAGQATPAAGVSAPGREMRPPPGLLAGNARGGSCRAEWGGARRGASRVGCGVDAGSPLRRARSFAGRPGPRGGSAGGVGSGTAIAPGVTGTRAP